MDKTLKIEPLTPEHAREVLEMMRVFYASPALETCGSEEIFAADIENCLNGSPYLEGYVFTDGDTVAGYSMEAKSFSTEFGCPCVWVEDLYLKPGYRGQRFAAEFFDFLSRKYPDAILRLEAAPGNASALRAYRRSGFEELRYLELKRGRAGEKE